jgi:SAM-dependent methyltransferase
MRDEDIVKILKTNINVNWLRPEKALCDTITSVLLRKYKIISPSLDLGCGNGFFSFITAGGDFSIDYDWFRNVDLHGFWENKDIFDTCVCENLDMFIIEKPHHLFSYGLDHKKKLLAQAKALHFYERLVCHDANETFPFKTETFKTVFSNILYWLPDPGKTLFAINRILQKGGHALLCLPNTNFFELCISYQWREKNSEILRLINRGRSECMHWTISYKDFCVLAKKAGFKVVDHTYYWSPLTLKAWDIGFRPLSCLLIEMANSLSDDKRRAIKAEWIETAFFFLMPLYELESKSMSEGGFHLFNLRKQ